MRVHYDTMKTIYKKLNQEKICMECADIMSVLAMTMGNDRDCLKYRLASYLNNIGDWGHEYVRLLYHL